MGANIIKEQEMAVFPKHDYEKISHAELDKTLKKLLVNWLERMPFLRKEYWETNDAPQNFWESYEQIFLNSLNEYENKESRLADFHARFFEND
jgi:hypothetical protein